MPEHRGPEDAGTWERLIATAVFARGEDAVEWTFWIDEREVPPEEWLVAWQEWGT